MAKKAASKKPARGSKVAPKRRASAKEPTKAPAFTSITKWKRTGAKRWPATNRPLARTLETEGVLGVGTPTPGPSVLQMAAARLAALVQAAAVSTPGTAGAQPTPPAPGSSNWTPLGPLAIPNGQTNSSARVLVSGRVTAIAIDPTAPDTIYLGAAQGGVWKSTDNGNSWTPKSDHEVSLAIGALAIDPNSPRTVYAGTGEGNSSLDSYYGLGILKSTDGGDSWNSFASTTFLTTKFFRLVVDPGSGTPAKRLFAATEMGLFRSIDGGESWNPLTSGLPAGVIASDVALDAAANTVYAAFWGDGIYKSSNANADTPTFTPLTTGLPVATAPSPNGVSRIALGISASNPQTVFALMANNDLTNYPDHDGAPYSYAIDKLYVTTNGGAAWNPIALPGPVTEGIGGQGFYNLSVAVDPTTPDILYLSAMSLWKAVKSGDKWKLTDIGGEIHSDHHVLTFRPGDHLRLWAGSDGGIYRSADGGATWDDSANKGLCIMQMEFIDQHPGSPAVVFGGTQDNGTEQYRGTPVFTHADDGDGGFVVVNQNDPTRVVSTYYYASPKRSLEGGKLGTWTSVAAGIGGTGSLFYPPMTACRTDVKAMALGTTEVNIDPAEGTGGWTTQVPLPGLEVANGEIIEFISALSYVSNNLIYAGTDFGKVYKLTFAKTWTAILISQAPLPDRPINEISPLPGDSSTIIVVMGQFGTGHVFRGSVPAKGLAAWSDITGDLRDIPVNALVIDPRNASRMFIGTDIGVFETTNAGTNWSRISAGSAGLPNCAIFDLRLHEATRILRAATHGRGLWEKPIDARSTPAIDIYVRDHVMDTARVFPPPHGIPAAFEDALRYVALGDPQYLWMCPDIKVDAHGGAVPSYQMPVADVDYVAFESRLQHRQPLRGRVNRVYVQIHNRGFQPAANVKVKVLRADASAGVPDLPADFWTAFPGDSTDTSRWQPVGAATTIASFQPGFPVVLEWDWTPPATAAEHSCMLVVMDSASDPIPAANKVFDIPALVGTEKRVGWKSLQVIDPLPTPAPGVVSAILSFQARAGQEQTIQIVPHGKKPPKVSMIFSKKAIPAKPKLAGLASKVPSKALLNTLTKKYGDKEIASFDTATAFTPQSSGKSASLSAVLGDKAVRAIIAIEGAAPGDGGAAFSIVQTEAGRIVGGSTFAMKSG